MSDKAATIMIKAMVFAIVLLVANTSIGQTDSTTGKIYRNIIGYDFTSPLFNELRISYERLLLHDQAGLRLSGSRGFPTDVWDNFNIWSTALEFRYYPFGQLRNTYSLGFMSKVGERYRYYNLYPGYYNRNYLDQYLAFYVRNGYVLRPLEHLSFSFVLGLGMLATNFDPFNWDRHANFEMTVEYRF